MIVQEWAFPLAPRNLWHCWYRPAAGQRFSKPTTGIGSAIGFSYGRNIRRFAGNDAIQIDRSPIVATCFAFFSWKAGRTPVLVIAGLACGFILDGMAA